MNPYLQPVSEDCMPTSSCVSERFSMRRWRVLGVPLAILGLALLTGPATAKDAPLSAVELYDGPSGPSYAIISGIAINQKNEVRGCGASDKAIAKNTYNDAQKIVLAAGMSLEYTQSNGFVLTKDGTPGCVVPSNIKF